MMVFDTKIGQKSNDKHHSLFDNNHNNIRVVYYTLKYINALPVRMGQITFVCRGRRCTHIHKRYYNINNNPNTRIMIIYNVNNNLLSRTEITVDVTIVPIIVIPRQQLMLIIQFNDINMNDFINIYNIHARIENYETVFSPNS